MPATLDRELRRLLSRAGGSFLRAGKGSHEIWQSPISGRRFSVPVGIVSRHTANGVLEQAGLPKAFCGDQAATEQAGKSAGPRATVIIAA
jgi:hypothetical protein